MGEEVKREDGGCTRKRERDRREGHGPAQSPLSADSFFPVLRLDLNPSLSPLTRARASLDHSYSPPPSHCLRPRRAFCHPHSISSAPCATGYQSLLPHPVLVLCSFATSSALHRFASNPASEHSGVPPALAPCPNRAGVLSHCKAHSTSTSALVVHYRVPDLLFLLYRRIYKANALLCSRPEHSPYLI
jgi:hypothetical protein